MPLKDLLQVPDVREAETTSLPGFQMFAQLPKVLKDDRTSIDVVESRVMADGTKVGENLQETLLLFPPATTTKCTAALTASAMAC